MAQTLQGIKQRFGIIGRSKALDQALGTASRVASTDLSVLITGESGVGKEVFSKIIHQLSARKHNKFIAINTGAIPEGTINSELFGHEKGAFTGATGERKGYFETVDGGTIFLDEIGEMPLDTQAFLLRVLESGEFFRVGSSKVLKTNVRVIAATNKSLEDKIKQGKFREDLYYRLNTVPIRVPSLKERPEDINLLFRKFASDFAEKYRTPPIRLDDKAELLIQNYTWPGNIRELKNVAEQLSVLAEERQITAEALMELIPNILNRNLPMVHEGGSGQDTFQERDILYKVLFDMRNEIHQMTSNMDDMKALIFELIRSNDLSVSDVQRLQQVQNSKVRNPRPTDFNRRDLNSIIVPSDSNRDTYADDYVEDDGRLIIQTPSQQNNYAAMEVVEESLSLEEMEKDLIRKALKKHGNRRRDAAADLGISERTLYRKIKQYEL